MCERTLIGCHMVRLRGIALLAAATLCGCSAASDYELAKEASREFDLRMDRREYATIYDQASPPLQAAETSDLFFRVQ